VSEVGFIDIASDDVRGHRYNDRPTWVDIFETKTVDSGWQTSSNMVNSSE
jgi:hypothetical protein